MFSKILIANRGEIACRVLRTCRSLGLRTVAVYSEADSRARHVRLADEAVRIGPPPAAESYLVVRRILDAAKRTGVQAIHPGYGFLAENAEFAEACAREGLVFIGPPPAAIRLLGSKSAARSLMERSGVPVIPGYHGDRQEPAFLREEAARIGYPVMIKASAGGGGKGMRIVENEGDFPAAMESCRREAHAAFGDDRLLIEKCLVRPRHVEVQLFADAHGNVVHLFERDCSVQRRHQKVLEEAPAPGMTAGRRAAMCGAACEAARAAGYVGAGTVEFLVDREGESFFLEMNTRLQVEHTVTEMVTGLDLVEWQIRVAAGKPLPLSQEQISLRGHAVEARIYAEDPARGFLPSTGRLVHLSVPAESLHVRVDTGVEEGDGITPHYDPMIAKLIVWDDSRERALDRMLQALAEFRVAGVANNVEFLSRLVASPAFAAADLDTGLIGRLGKFLFPADEEAPREVYLVAALAELLREAGKGTDAPGSGGDPHSPWSLPDGWRLNSQAQRPLKFRLGEREKTVQVRYAQDLYALSLDGATTAARGEFTGDVLLRAELGGRRLNATVVVSGEKRHIFFDGRAYPLSCIDPLHHGSETAGPEGGLVAPMPGTIIALLAEPGSRVEKGTPLLILEAMKMEHTIAAPSAGVLRSFRFGTGSQVSEGAELVEFQAEK